MSFIIFGIYKLIPIFYFVQIFINCHKWHLWFINAHIHIYYILLPHFFLFSSLFSYIVDPICSFGSAETKTHTTHNKHTHSLSHFRTAEREGEKKTQNFQIFIFLLQFRIPLVLSVRIFIFFIFFFSFSSPRSHFWCVGEGVCWSGGERTAEIRNPRVVEELVVV